MQFSKEGIRITGGPYRKIRHWVHSSHHTSRSILMNWRLKCKKKKPNPTTIRRKHRWLFFLTLKWVNFTLTKLWKQERKANAFAYVF